MPPNFTGWLAERAELTQWLEQDGQRSLLLICALGGFGKSALAWHWLLHDVDAARWPRVDWWSFYEPQASFESFLAGTLAYLGVDLRRTNGAHDNADRHLTEALTRCRSINAVDGEADILLDLARLRRDQAQSGGSFGPAPQDDRMGEALRLAREALAISERSGYVLQGADVRLLLAQLSLDAGDRAAALEHARQARQLATCDGPPDYTYKVAYDEAGALVERLDHEAAK